MPEDLKRWLKLCRKCDQYIRRKSKRNSSWGGWTWRRVMVCDIVYCADKYSEPMVADDNFKVPAECPYRLEIMVRKREPVDE